MLDVVVPVPAFHFASTGTKNRNTVKSAQEKKRSSAAALLQIADDAVVRRSRLKDPPT